MDTTQLTSFSIGPLGSQVHANSATLNAMYKAKSPQKTAAFRGNSVEENSVQADSTSSSIDSLEQALQGHGIDSDNQQTSEIDGSLASQITADHAQDDDIDNNANAFAAPQVEISGKVANSKNIDGDSDEGIDGSKMFPSGGNLNKLEVSTPKYNQAASRGDVPGKQVSPTTLRNNNTRFDASKPVFDDNVATLSPPTLNNGKQGKEAFQPLTTGAKEASQPSHEPLASNLPPPRHLKEESAFLLPVNNGAPNIPVAASQQYYPKLRPEIASLNSRTSNPLSLPPLKFSESADSKSLPFVNSGVDQSQNLLSLLKGNTLQDTRLTHSNTNTGQTELRSTLKDGSQTQESPASFLNLDGKQTSNPFSANVYENQNKYQLPNKLNLHSVEKTIPAVSTVYRKEKGYPQTQNIPFLNLDVSRPPKVASLIQGKHNSNLVLEQQTTKRTMGYTPTHHDRTNSTDTELPSFQFNKERKIPFSMSGHGSPEAFNSPSETTKLRKAGFFSNVENLHFLNPNNGPNKGSSGNQHSFSTFPSNQKLIQSGSGLPVRKDYKFGAFLPAASGDSDVLQSPQLYENTEKAGFVPSLQQSSDVKMNKQSKGKISVGYMTTGDYVKPLLLNQPSLDYREKKFNNIVLHAGSRKEGLGHTSAAETNFYPDSRVSEKLFENVNSKVKPLLQKQNLLSSFSNYKQDFHSALNQLKLEDNDLPTLNHGKKQEAILSPLEYEVGEPEFESSPGLSDIRGKDLKFGTVPLNSAGGQLFQSHKQISPYLQMHKANDRLEKFSSIDQLPEIYDANSFDSLRTVKGSTSLSSPVISRQYSKYLPFQYTKTTSNENGPLSKLSRWQANQETVNSDSFNDQNTQNSSAYFLTKFENYISNDNKSFYSKNDEGLPSNYSKTQKSSQYRSEIGDLDKAGNDQDNLLKRFYNIKNLEQSFNPDTPGAQVAVQNREGGAKANVINDAASSANDGITQALESNQLKDDAGQYTGYKGFGHMKGSGNNLQRLNPPQITTSNEKSKNDYSTNMEYTKYNNSPLRSVDINNLPLETNPTVKFPYSLLTSNTHALSSPELGARRKAYPPPAPLAHAQSPKDVNFYHSNLAEGPSARYQVTTDAYNNYLPPLNHATNALLPPLNHGGLPPLNHKFTSENGYGQEDTLTGANLPPLNHGNLPPLNNRYTSEKSYGETTGFNGYTEKGPYQDPMQESAQTRQYPIPNFPPKEDGHPYPLPLPPEGDNDDDVMGTNGYGASYARQFPTRGYSYGSTLIPEEPATESETTKKNLIRPKPDLKCGDGWKGAYGDFGTFCYKEVYEHKTWDEAHGACKQFGGELFSVKNAYEQRFLENFTNIESWIGYRDKSVDGTWRWSDGNTAVYTNWDSSSVDDRSDRRDCVMLDAKQGKWRDAPCAQKHNFICKRNSDDCVKGWKRLSLNNIKGCYKLMNGTKSWEDAEEVCVDQGGNLASILSDDEQTMVAQVYSNENLWIGYNDKDNEGDWVWTDRMTSSYTNWDDKSPNNGGVTCAIVTRKGGWHDESCKNEYSFICRKPSPKNIPKYIHDMLPPVATLVANKSLNPELDDSVSIFGRKSVAPINFWTAQKIFNNKIHGSNPIAAHGKIRSINGGLQLNGQDSWLDAGDFFGQCLGDPDLCIKGFSYALQLNFDDDVKQYKDKRYVLDSSGGSRGVSVYIQNGTVHYKVVTSGQTWDLETDLVTNEWQDIVLTWKKEEGLMLYVNGAFRDSQKESIATEPVPNKQARLTIGRKSGNPPFKYTRLYMSSLLAFTRFLAPEDIPYVFTYDDTVVPRYMWLLPKIENMAIPGSPDIAVHGPVKAVDGGIHLDGLDSYLKVGDFKGKCIHDPEKCIHGLSFSCKLKFDQIVRSYKKRHYILDSGGHKDGAKGLSAYLLNNNLYFDLAVSTPEDTLTWTVRTNIYTVRWQRVALTWSLEKGLWLYIDNQFRSYTKRPRSKPRDVVSESSEFLIGRKNIGDETSPAQFSIGSIGIFDRFLDPEKKEIEKIFGGKKMPYPGLIREVWKELSGDTVAQLKDDPYFPNDPSLIEIIENFDSPFDVEKDYGTKVRGYFVAPETGNYTFYLAGSKSGELMLSKDESESNLTSLVKLDKPTGHNQWNKYAVQISATVNLEAGKYYYITALQKGTESTDSLSAGVRLPSGRFMRPISKEVLQWRLPGDPFAGVIRELWNDVSGYKISDLTSNPDFPNNPSSIEVLDKFDAPFNVGDNYGSRVRGFFKAPETGYYRFFLAADTTGELWLSSDESERNLKKIVTMTGWTEHNEWLKFREQKSEKIHLKKGQYYFLSVYHKADKLADCVSVAVEFPNGHFEGPIKKTHLSWRLPDGKTGPGPSFEQEAIPKPVGLFPFTKFYKGDDVSGNAENGVLNNVELAAGPNDKEGGAYELKGTADSFVEIPNTGKLDTRYAMTILANIYPTGNGGPIVNYMTDGWGVHLWQFENNELFVRFVHRNGVFHKPIGSRVLQRGKWNQVGATYDNNTGVAQLWHNGKMVKSRNIGNIQLATQYSLRIGARDGDDRRFAGKITCLQIYDKALDESQIGNLKTCPVKAKSSEGNEAGSGSGSGAWEGGQSEATEIAPTHTTGRYDKDDEAEDEIQGTQGGSASKCSPNPCENSAQCIRDSKRIDGYRCKCTSDFTGRDCQVSKPDAENPIVKRTNVPKAEKKESSTDFQKNNTATDIGDQLREEKKEDVFLLFQKIGCYNDEAVQHDLPDGLTLKSVSQEDCVRACALEEKGYSFFGLQNSDKCYCGHKYGKYGKADDATCNMKCRDNSDENCGGKSSNVVYFFGLGTNYTVSTFTGDEEGADTNANVYITLYGEKGDSGFRKLSSKQHVRGKEDSETLLLPDLGKLKQVRVLHDNSGAAPSWYLDKLTVTDENGKVYNFPCKEWLSETQGGGKTERLLRLSSS